ncbi:hypothetical protein MRB53_041480 [Persea americana]|nr:hypothetical protein MRB53_041480 [Persea americana]
MIAHESPWTSHPACRPDILHGTRVESTVQYPGQTPCRGMMRPDGTGDHTHSSLHGAYSQPDAEIEAACSAPTCLTVGYNNVIPSRSPVTFSLIGRFSSRPIRRAGDDPAYVRASGCTSLLGAPGSPRCESVEVGQNTSCQSGPRVHGSIPFPLSDTAPDFM